MHYFVWYDCHQTKYWKCSEQKYRVCACFILSHSTASQEFVSYRSISVPTKLEVLPLNGVSASDSNCKYIAAIEIQIYSSRQLGTALVVAF
jgi:hypothetical protein